MQLLISDAIVSWRACVIWYDSRIVKYTLIVLMAGNIGMNIEISQSNI